MLNSEIIGESISYGLERMCVLGQVDGVWEVLPSEDGVKVYGQGVISSMSIKIKY